MKVALVHDWLTGMRGGEKVLEALVRALPGRADLHAGPRAGHGVPDASSGAASHTSFVQWLPAAGRYYRHYLPLFPIAIEQFDLDGFDLVISTSHCAAKSVVVPGRARHVCYCHSPMRYAWDQFDAYFGPAQVGRVRSRAAAAGPGAPGALGRRHRAPAWTASWPIPDMLRGRIRRYYNREAASCIPLWTRTSTARPPPGAEYFLIVSALVPYKRIDMAIDARAELAGVPLKIVGRGPERSRLRAMAGPNVEFLGCDQR